MTGPARLAQPGPEVLDFLQQVQDQGDAGQVDFQVALQADGAARPPELGCRKAPGRLVRDRRLDDALVDQVDDLRLPDPARVADLGEGQSTRPAGSR